LVSSPTGSGKTLTAFMSIINGLTKYASEGKLEEKVYCVYISPLKALANDVNRNLNEPLAQMRELAESKGMDVPNIRVAVRSGDTPQNERQKMSRHPPHILITTPESLALILSSPKFKLSLKDMQWLILDEIHDICDSKRGVFLSLTVERLQKFCNKRFSRIGLSATMAPMDAIAGFLAGCDSEGEPRDVTLIESDSKKILDLKVICPTEDMTALPTEVVSSMMYDKLKELVDDHKTTLVFTNTRSGAESVVYKLKERGLESVEVHHSSLGKDIRLDVEERLKHGEIRCVVSSTSLELGIDIGSVDLVCQIGSPKSVAKGLQRIGRSGHSFGKIAKGRIIVFDPDDLVECAVMCRAAHRSDIDRVRIPENCLDVLAQSIVGMSLDSRWDVDDAYDTVRASYCYRNLTRDKFIDVLRYLGSKEEHEGVYSKIWYDVDEGQFGKKKGARMIYYMNMGTIPQEANYRVVTNYGSVAGELSEKFVERLAPRDVFVLGGRSMEFVRSKGMTAFVKEAEGRKPTVPSWSGEMLPRSFDLSMDVAYFRKEMSGMLGESSQTLIPKLSKNFDIDEGSARSLISYFSEQDAVAGFIPDSDMLAIEEYIDPSGNQRLIFHYPFGRRVNDALSRAYAYRISDAIGANASITVTDDDFMIGVPKTIDVNTVPHMLRVSDLEPVLRKAVKDSEIFKLRFRCTAARSFMILRNYRGRPISVNRQQVRSSYLLDMLSDLENEPVIEETYREIMEDDMDLKDARIVLEQICNGKIGVKIIPFTGTPSPFAHSVILSGFSDIVLMEDRTALLKELHRKVLARALGGKIREFEFDDDSVIQYFRKKTGHVTCKDDIPELLMRTGPLQVFKDRGRCIYPYCDEDKKTVDGWVRELLKEGVLGTVFMDECHVMTASDIPVYSAATRRERVLTEVDKKVLEVLDGEMQASEITKKLNQSSDVTFRAIRKLESMYLITCTRASANNRWYHCRCEPSDMDRNKAIDDIILRYLYTSAPATVSEVAFALSLKDDDVSVSLKSLTEAGETVKGRFIITESDQYMLSMDRMRLRAGKDNVFDHETIDRYRLTKGEKFDSIEEYFDYYCTASSVIDVYNRVPNFNLDQWQNLRANGRILKGRFLRGKVRYVMDTDADKLAALRIDETRPGDEEILKRIDGAGTITMRKLAAAMGKDKESVKEALRRLDGSLKIVRAYSGREDWGTENKYAAYNPNEVDEDPSSELIERMVRAYGPVPISELRYLLPLTVDVSIAAEKIGASVIYAGSEQAPMLIMPEEIGELDPTASTSDDVRILSLFDPDIVSKWAELSSRYGDKWMYPVVKGSHIAGAVEAWEMSGCIEIRAIDVDSPDMIPAVLDALENFMGFFEQKGYSVMRIRDILGKDVSDLEPPTVKALTDREYFMVNGFYAKGNLVKFSMTENEMLALLFRKQRMGRLNRYRTLTDLINDRGYIRGDQEMVSRAIGTGDLRKEAEYGRLFKMTLVPMFVGYTSSEMAPYYRAYLDYEEHDSDMKIIEKLIAHSQPISKKEIINASPLSDKKTSQVLLEMSKHGIVYRDTDSYYSIVPQNGISRQEAEKILIKGMFKEYGMLSAEMIGYFVNGRMSGVRSTLAELEEDGFLVKGFLLEDDSTLYWMLAEEMNSIKKSFRGLFLLNPQDNMYNYLRSYLKARDLSSKAVVFKGTEIIGSFKGKISRSGAKVKDFEGTDEAMRFIHDTARSLGAVIDNGEKDEDEDWDVTEFYIKTNPGA